MSEHFSPKKFEKFGRYLRHFRKKRGLSQELFANRLNELTGLNVRKNTISNYETSTSFPAVGIIPYIAVLLEVTIDELFHGERRHDLASRIRKDDSPVIAHKIVNETVETTLDLNAITKIKLERKDLKDLSEEDLRAELKKQYEVSDQLLEELMRLKDLVIYLSSRITGFDQ
ncbi:MAG: helix-turn-helix domain-containing protein [Cytophagales bacterium]|nr:helix-turn-helix domain-containing protein [Cytophagales bacterium]